jgi:PIF1 helicase.
MTINKARGQTLRAAGIDLTTQCFSHGQLYVALSCVTSKQNMFILTHNQEEVINVVHKEIFSLFLCL